MSVKRKDRPYRDALREALADREEAANYLSVALADSSDAFSKACLNVVDALQVGKRDNNLELASSTERLHRLLEASEESRSRTKVRSRIHE